MPVMPPCEILFLEYKHTSIYNNNKKKIEYINFFARTKLKSDNLSIFLKKS